MISCLSWVVFFLIVVAGLQFGGRSPAVFDDDASDADGPPAPPEPPDA